MADQEEYLGKLKELREVNRLNIRDIKDLGFLSRADRADLTREETDFYSWKFLMKSFSQSFHIIIGRHKMILN